MNELPARKPNRLQGYDYSQNGMYFITICTKNQEEIFGHVVGAVTCRPHVELSNIGQIADKSIQIINDVYPHITIDKYVIMPNHIHMIICIGDVENGRQVAAPTSVPPTVQTVVGNMKRYVSIQCGSSIWQRSYYDHIIRSENDYQRIWRYIDENPIKWKEDHYYASGRSIKSNTERGDTHAHKL
jgi:REP element-mobilizing transposase RayT